MKSRVISIMNDKDILRAIAAVSDRSNVSIDKIRIDLDMLELQDKLAIMKGKGLIKADRGTGVGIYSVILTPEGREALRSPPAQETDSSHCEHVFICYAHDDEEATKKLVSDLKPILEKKNIEVWIDEESLIGGEKWRVAIPSAIKDSLAFLSIMSKKSVDKEGYIQKELRYALDKLDELPEPGIFIIPVRLEECEPSHSRINDLNWVDMFRSWEKGLSKIIVSIEAQQKEKRFRSIPSVSPAPCIDIPTVSILPLPDARDMQVLKIIGDCLIEKGLGLFSQTVLQEAERLGIDKKDTLESIHILDDLSYLNIDSLSRDVFHIKGFSFDGFGEYASNFLADYGSLRKLVVRYIVSSSDADSDSISNALSVDVFVVNNILKMLEDMGRINLVNLTTLGRHHHLYQVTYVSPLLKRES